MPHQRLLGGPPIAHKSTFEQRAMLAGCGLAPVDSRDHLIAQIPIVDHGMRVEQHLRPTRGNKRVVKLPVIALPGLGVGAVARRHALLHLRQLMVSRDDTTFPLHVARFERFLQRVTFE